MGKKKSSLMAYFINIGSAGSPNWARLGKGVTEIPIAYNPQVTTEPYVDEDNASNSLDSYQPQAGINVALYDDTTAPAHAFLEAKRKVRAIGSDAEVQILEIDLSGGSSPYPASLQNAIIVMDTFTIAGGQPQQLAVTIYYNGDPTIGTATVANGVPTYTPTGKPALSMSSIVPADGATDQLVGVNIVITFSNKIQAEAVAVIDEDGAAIAVTRSWNAAGTILTLNPDSNLTAGTTYYVVLAGVVDVYGQLLAGAGTSFTTAA